LQKDGTPSSIEPQIQAFLKKLQMHFPQQSIERYDERYTSKIAFRSMIDGGLTKKKRSDKGTLDEVSAVIILQSYLEYKTNTL
jgi:putative Holliday junction resolvase